MAFNVFGIRNIANKSITLTVFNTTLILLFFSEIKRLPLEHYIHISNLAALIIATVFQY